MRFVDGGHVISFLLQHIRSTILRTQIELMDGRILLGNNSLAGVLLIKLLYYSFILIIIKKRLGASS